MKKLIGLLSLLLFANVAMAQTVTFSDIKENSATATITLNEKIKTNVFIKLGNASLPSVDDKSINKDEKNIPSLIKSLNANEAIAIIQLDNGKKIAKLENLQAGVKYSIVLTNDKIKTKEFTFSTLAAEPNKQSKTIGFKNVTSNSMELVWMKGNGKYSLVVASKEKEPAAPQDGKSYKASDVFGTAGSKIDAETFVVYSGKNNFCKVNNLSSGKYFFRVFEFNGESETSNYNLSKTDGNPRFKTTTIAAPKALPAKNLIPGGFTANWTAVPGAKSYEIQVAYDPDFKDSDEAYNIADVGDITSIEIVELKADKKYYFRVRTVGEQSRSEFSNIIRIE